MKINENEYSHGQERSKRLPLGPGGGWGLHLCRPWRHPGEPQKYVNMNKEVARRA